MTGIPSIGDLLLLSQLAWRIGCAFTAGRPSAPPEFHEVENELKTLTKSLDILAEALDDDNNILARGDDRVKVGVNKVLSHCGQCLEDLNVFVTKYQDVKRPASEVSARGIQGAKTWKPTLLENWRSVWWTTEGGSIQSVFYLSSCYLGSMMKSADSMFLTAGQALRNMLHSHVNFINLTTKALQR
jgi:hypothetical protein